MKIQFILKRNKFFDAVRLQILINYFHKPWENIVYLYSLIHFSFSFKLWWLYKTFHIFNFHITQYIYYFQAGLVLFRSSAICPISFLNTSSTSPSQLMGLSSWCELDVLWSDLFCQPPKLELLFTEFDAHQELLS